MCSKINEKAGFEMVICAGAQKAGTSWLFKCLEEHPSICTATGKETYFFDTEVEDISDYEKFFSHCPDKPIRFEASTFYLYNPKTPRRIKHFFPDAKLIIILRNPVDRFFSHLRHWKNKGAIPSSISTAECIEQYAYLIENSRYSRFVKNYQSEFGHDQLLILDYQEIVRNPEITLQTVFDYLNIDKIKPHSLHKRYNSNRAKNHFVYRKIITLYFVLKRSAAGRNFIQLLKKVGVNNANAEHILAKTSKPLTPPKREDVDLVSSLLSDEIIFYNNFFKKNT